MLQQKYIDYHDGEHLLEAYMAFDDRTTTPKPAVIVVHDWSGKNEFARKKADELAELGYIGFACDMFGKGVLGTTKEEKSALIQPLLQDRQRLQQRMLAAVNTLLEFNQVDKEKIGAIGFCFGGLCVLDLARTGTDIKGVVSFHGLFSPPENHKHQLIKAKVLALHGYDDPMGTPDQVMSFATEMTKAKADWQIHMYGNTMHAFTNPEANDPSFGTVYDKKADIRSWIAMKDFFGEVFK
ncbi:MAG: carboxymethylenebutenolidase [Gammaproteobacteria bacterium RIFCSPHIGHO2_12_FULL_43_28]|nr:MAG: carboxymethylenebutenolidase [Gammaproteobacteria bacterium RIFCSPHIGHO2_12_FULL_43_28]